MAGVVNANSEIWKNWDKTGKTEFLKACAVLVKDENKSIALDKTGKIPGIVSNISTLIDKGLKGQLKVEHVTSTLQEMVALHPDVPSLVLDVLSITDASCVPENSSDESKERHNFCMIVKDCEKFLSDKLLKERLEIDTLQEVGILKNRTFYSKFIKVKTKLYYKQRKFNLFREESEGYAKLITELNQSFGSNVTHETLLDIVQSLIGCFNLDPNRVLDVILESFENKPEDANLFVPLICSYMKDPKIVCEVLATKLTFLRNSENLVPRSLYILIAQLLQHKIITLDDIYPWLLPEDKIMFKECETAMKDAKEYVKKLQIISISNKDKEETSEEPENPIEKYNANQKLGLCEALLSVGDWENARKLINQLPKFYAISFQPVALAMCNLLHAIIEPVYREFCKLGPKIKGKPIPPPKNPLSPQPARTFLELREHAIPMLITLGASLRYDPVLMCKVIRISRAALSSYGIESAKNPCPEEDSLYHDIITIMDTTVLPSLSYMDCNCCIAEEIWTVLRLYPYQMRYCLYSRWKNETYSLYSDLMKKRGDSEKQIKNIMKRVSKENIKPVGRLIGKLTHCSPGFLFDYILLQIQVYSNLIHPVVDSLKYLTNLSYDVLGYCLIECLANADKKRVKHDSTSISTWLQSLSSFCGAVYKKYMIELSGLLQYVANQLKAQKSLDLLILKEVVQKMAGVEAAEDLTIDQVNAMAGGELLKAEAGYFSQVRNTKKSSLRLKEAMSEHNLAVALCLLMAQQKYCVVYRETQKNHLKLVGKLADQCQDTLVQFGTFLGSSLSVDEYVNKLPTIQSMLVDYHIPTEVAFFLARPMFNHAINIKYDQLRKSDPNYKKLGSTVKNQKYFEAVTEVMEPVHKSIIPLHPMKIWEDISPQFLTTFWSLTMYDLFVPDETYQQVISKAKQQSAASMEASSNNTKGKKEQERFQTLIEKLQDEKKKQHEHVEKVMYRLKQEKDSWFLSRSAKSAKNETITRFLQLCLFPRCTFTSIDAVYCAKFVHTIHMLKTPNFSTLLCYDRLFCDITYSVTSCTENEAMRYGRFLYAMLETVMRWHKSKDLFEKECANYPGFVTKYRVNNQHADNLDNVGYENYRHVCHKWHYKLAKAMVTCLESKDYVQIRNALIILIKIIPFFPVLQKLGQFIEKRIEKVRDEEKNNRQDLFTLSSSYLGLLKQRMIGGHMVKESDFHQLVEKEKVVKIQENKSDSASSSKHNGEAKEESSTNITNSSNNTGSSGGTSGKDKVEKKVKPEKLEEPKPPAPKAPPAERIREDASWERLERSERPYKEEPREKHSTSSGGGSSSSRREEKRDDFEKEREKEKRRERKEEKMAKQEERQFREERYIEISPKEEMRYSSDRQIDRYFDERNTPGGGGGAGGGGGGGSLSGGSGGGGGGHYYREVRGSDEREISLNSSNNSSGGGGLTRHSQEPETDREVKRRKMDSSSLKSSKHEDRKLQQQIDYVLDKQEKKERPSKIKEKREKIVSGGGGGGSQVGSIGGAGVVEDDKEFRKERKMGRKRDRTEEAIQQAELKRRRDEEKAAKLSHPNGEILEPPIHPREKHHRARELSPPYPARERSHDDRLEMREKHRRSAENKRR